MKQINTLSLLILFGSFSSTLLGMDFSFLSMDFSFNEEDRKEEIKGMSRQQCLDFRTKQLHKLKKEAVKEIFKGDIEEFDTMIKDYKKLFNSDPQKSTNHDPAIPQEWLSIITQTLQEEGINPNNISIKTINDDCYAARFHIDPTIVLKINVDFIQENVIKENQRLFIQETILHEISHITNDDVYWQYFLKDCLLSLQIKYNLNSKNLNQKNALLINKFTQSYERIALLNSSCKSKELAQYMNKEFQKRGKHNWPNYPPIEDLREWSTRLCDCWDLPEEKSS